MKNIKIEISYDGTNYSGFQRQPRQKTIQGELEKAIAKLTQEKTNLIGSGRTDAGVHARKQVCNFITSSKIPIDRWVYALNSILPSDIVVTNAFEVEPNFHARYNVRRKTYQYTVYNNLIPNVFERNYVWHVSYPLDVELMRIASQYFIGQHDFTAFSSSKSASTDRVREIYSIEIDKKQSFITFEITGNGFLYNMVRIMVGTLVEIGKHRMDKNEVQNLLINKDRKKAGITAPPQGLKLWDVEY